MRTVQENFFSSLNETIDKRDLSVMRRITAINGEMSSTTFGYVNLILLWVFHVFNAAVEALSYDLLIEW